MNDAYFKVAIAAVISAVRNKYPDVDQERLREILKNELAVAIEQPALTSNDMMKQLDERVRKELMT